MTAAPIQKHSLYFKNKTSYKKRGNVAKFKLSLVCRASYAKRTNELLLKLKKNNCCENFKQFHP